MKSLNNIRLRIGDPSDDGHGRVEDIFILSFLTPLEIEKAFEKGSSLLGVNIEHLCRDYGDYKIPKKLINWLCERSDNSYSVIYTSSSIAIDGFIIEGGHADASSGSDRNKSGAAMYIYNNGNTIRNCVFRNNFGSEDGAIVKFRGPTSINS